MRDTIKIFLIFNFKKDATYYKSLVRGFLKIVLEDLFIHIERGSFLKEMTS